MEYKRYIYPSTTINKQIIHIFLHVCIDPEKWTSTSGTGKSVPVSAVVEGEFFL